MTNRIALLGDSRHEKPPTQIHFFALCTDTERYTFFHDNTRASIFQLLHAIDFCLLNEDDVFSEEELVFLSERRMQYHNQLQDISDVGSDEEAL